MPRIKGDRYVLLVTISNRKKYQAYANYKGKSLSELAYNLLQNEIGETEQRKTNFRTPRASELENNLFNGAQKMKYLKTITSESQRRKAISLFYKARPFEDKYGVDLAEWNDDCLRSFLLECKTDLAVESYRNIRTTIRSYIRYCRENGIIYSDSIFFVAQ